MDRNSRGMSTISYITASLSARRAWIEISIKKSTPAKPFSVALRKESVDRNIGASYGRTAKMVSLSARRAWIEMIVG